MAWGCIWDFDAYDEYGGGGRRRRRRRAGLLILLLQSRRFPSAWSREKGCVMRAGNKPLCSSCPSYQDQQQLSLSVSVLASMMLKQRLSWQVEYACLQHLSGTMMVFALRSKDWMILSQSLRLEVEVNQYQDPRCSASSTRLIPRDTLRRMDCSSGLKGRKGFWM